MLFNQTIQEKRQIVKEGPLFQVTNITKTNSERNEGSLFASWVGSYQLEFVHETDLLLTYLY